MILHIQKRRQYCNLLYITDSETTDFSFTPVCKWLLLIEEKSIF